MESGPAPPDLRLAETQRPELPGCGSNVRQRQLGNRTTQPDYFRRWSESCRKLKEVCVRGDNGKAPGLSVLPKIRVRTMQQTLGRRVSGARSPETNRKASSRVCGQVSSNPSKGKPASKPCRV